MPLYKGILNSEVAVCAAGVGAAGHGSTNTKIRRFTTTSTNTGTDITYADSAANGGSFTINTAGIYAITYVDSRTDAATQIGITRNSASLTTNVQSLTYPEVLATVTTGGAGVPGFLAATFIAASGDIIRAHDAGGANDSTGVLTNFRIVRVA